MTERSDDKLRPEAPSLASAHLEQPTDLYGRYRGELLVLVRRTISRPPPEPEDIVQQTFANFVAHHAGDSAGDVANARAYLVLSNYWNDELQWDELRLTCAARYTGEMFFSIQPLQFLLTLLAGWINRRQLEAIDYLKEENRLLKERLGGWRLRFTDAERRRLARRAYALGRKALSELYTLVTPDTLMRWYRTLVAQKWTYTHRRRPGRPRTMQVIVQLIVRIALENRSWGYTRIQGALANLGHDVSRGAIANVLGEHGIDPAPERGKRTSWSTFLKAHWDSIAATDFFTVEVLTLRGLVTYYILFVIDLASRTVKIAGITSHPDDVWMMQMARNLTDAEEPFLRHTRFLIMDRDTKYSAAFRAALTRERIEPIRLPPRSPNLNAYAERFVRSVKTECTGRMVFFNRSSLERALTHYVAHYHEERNHQGLQNRLLKCSDGPIKLRGRVARRERLGGMLNFYHREAA